MNEDSFDVNYLNYLLDLTGLKKFGKDLTLSEIKKILDKSKITWRSHDGTEKIGISIPKR